MKTQKKLNIALTILVIILISLISFVGIYHQDKNQMVSILPDYILGTNASGYRYITLLPKDIEDGTESESIDLGEAQINNESIELGEEQIDNENSTEQENSDGNNTNTVNSTENVDKPKQYEKAIEIFKKRLKDLKIEDFSVASDKETGKIEIRLPENEQTDSVLSDLVQKGNFVISDTNTGEVLLTNNDVKSVDVTVTDNYGYSVVGMTINFNLNGSKIFKNITEEYNSNATVPANVVDDNEVDNNEVDELSEEGVLNETSNEENSTEDENLTEEETEGDENATDESTTEEERVEKTIDLKIDDTVMLSTSFSEIVDNGKLELTMGSFTDDEELKSSLYGSYNIATIIENEPLPVDYEMTGNIYVASPIQESNINILVYILIGLFVIISIVMIVKFKMRGVLSAILSMGYMAILLIAIRYTNVTLSLEGIFGIGLSLIINAGFYYMLFDKIKDKKLTREEKIENYNKTFKKYCLSIIPLIILSVICCFTNWDSIYSFGMVMFWAMDISILYNLIFTNFIIRSK